MSNKMQRYTVYFIWKLLYMFRVVPSPIIRNANNCIYSVWYLSHRYCYLPLSWKSWNWCECAVGGVRHPQHTDLVQNVRNALWLESDGKEETKTYLRKWSKLCTSEQLVTCNMHGAIMLLLSNAFMFENRLIEGLSFIKNKLKSN